jgi:putative Mn2+ efflux pump MntP
MPSLLFCRAHEHLAAAGRLRNSVAKLIALVLPLGLDTFAVGAALGMAGLPERHRLGVSVLFTAFEGGMPIIGLALGAPLGRAIGSSADYIAIAVLIGFGLYTLLRREDDETEGIANFAERGVLGTLLLDLSISIDELAIGFTLGLLRVPVIAVIIAIAAQAFVVTQFGLRLGTRLSHRARDNAERLGGLALTTLGAVLLTENLLT